MLPPDWASRLAPRSHELVIERAAESYKYKGTIWIPDSSRTKRRPPLARILAIGRLVDPSYDLTVGDLVMVSLAAGAGIHFGTNTSDLRTLHTCTPAAIFGRVHTEEVTAVVDHPGRYETRHPTDDLVEEDRAEHGVRT